MGDIMTREKKVLRYNSMNLVLDILRNDGPSSQAAIARKTGLSRATVNNVIQLMHKEGVADLDWINGREALVSLISTKGVMMSVVVSSDAIHGAVFDFGKQQRHDLHVPLQLMREQQNSPHELIRFIKRLAESANVLLPTFAGICVSIQAPVDKKAGTIASWSAGRLPHWRDVTIKDTLEACLQVSVHIENDSNLATYAEWAWGAGRGVECFLYLSCSQQIGSGLIINGKIHHGGNGMAGELGHLVIDSAGPVCFCGSRGCLTTLVSERAILRTLEAAGNSQHSLREVIGNALQGNAFCQRILYETGRNIGKALGNAVKIIAPSMVAIGGELSTAWPFIKESLRIANEENNLDNVSPGIQFVSGILRKDVVLLGGVAVLLSQAGQGISDLPYWMLDEADTLCHLETVS